MPASLPLPPKLMITKPRIVMPSPSRWKPGAKPPPTWALPSRVTTGAPAKVGCVVASIVVEALTVGRFEVGLIVVWPAGRSKWIALPGAARFAALIASRSVQSRTVQLPSSWSSFVLTTNGLDCATSVAVTQAENSDVLSSKSCVAVAVIASPGATGAERPEPVSIVTKPSASACRCEKPMKVAPSPNPDGSHDGDAKYSIVEPLFGLLVVNVPWIRTLPFKSNDALARAGKLWPWFPPPVSPMPFPPFRSIEFCEIRSASPPLTWTPSCKLFLTLLPAMPFPELLVSIAAPFFVFVTVLPLTMFWTLSTAIPLSCELATKFPKMWLSLACPFDPPPARQAPLNVEMPRFPTPKSGACDAFVPIVFDTTVLLSGPQMSMP